MINAISNVMISNVNTYYVKESEDKKREADRRNLYSGDSSFMDLYISKISAVESNSKFSSSQEGSKDERSSTPRVKESPSSETASYDGSSIGHSNGFGKGAAIYNYRPQNSAYRMRLALEAYGN